MYNDKICDHFMNPRNIGVLEKPDYVVEIGNPICGDTIHLYLDVKNKKVIDIKFQAYGCTGSIATASILSEIIKGSTLEEISAYTEEYVAEVLGELEPSQMHCIDIGVNILSYSSEPWKHIKVNTDYLVEEGELVE
ncbi:iron-sulfur cluster assembly scaffold protein [Alkalihalophilus lindianensis]|uniref:Iron-sulfur cluster assembly scaffold protein n=1 Tax=Alkalihalophilus lindianensis TaxID=1630542 RepID=A0ABU3X823_9BACI|nr:iron-sulfur cluster assembly scaffold protein [Alkalihalophilus lindianensis]MDV2684024.1 iron-sulfur cluster assembly scaffold protein [Alkalihalophilus lindianensis]